jgi:hypothetical protein
MNEEVQEGKVSAVTKEIEDLTKDINALDDKVNALGAHLSQVMSAELTDSIENAKGVPTPMTTASPLLQKIEDASRHVGLIGKHVQRLTERLEV